MKKIITIGLILAATMSLVACKDNSKSKESKDEPVNVVNENQLENENTENVKFVSSDEITEEEREILREIMEFVGINKNDEIEITVYKKSGVDIKIFKNGDKSNVKKIHAGSVGTDVEEGTYIIKMKDSNENGSITIEKTK